ncbi:TPA: nitrate/nitrite two-component system sensor histidine kinase NarQ [Citrobacter farmeri]|uniref:Nitrate/nitrite two-component system sensor histidine kinase NarQ n=1 Tax=Citrobacter farmeri TaxID=67824 RepID=A0ACA8D9H9_9ENTR|nr:nitrate/nitrite two-component system sensor histidine kinase NarQ [Citrobacter farmeri]AST80903.1 nitrate/nitrite two-component system sensor histidine kinase NarQ [Citrobacter farmeri]HAT2748340.1 nitrate/nitrite two-component system sensor histidine kinase NarQ [Citrobacter farmeri]HBI2991584.1 nitrate/nitrite two-component system sensor histidine kinase NarQ [Citrobacter farmeri]HBI2997511.1 nitrate/nitrite two-component system sensor histidine kinase NarQ [Citrobacter farmeri]HBI3002410
MIVKRPVSASLARAFFYIVLLSILSTGVALLTLASSLRDAEAINVAGSLRMQSYRLGYDLQSQSPQLNAHRQLFQQALNSSALDNLNAWYVPQAVKGRYAQLHANWLEMNRRLVDGDLQWYQDNINAYVDKIDLFVLALQHYAERKVMLVVGISLAGGFGIFTLVFFTLRRIRHQVVRPLNQLVMASQRIEHGQFDSPPLDTHLPNELGLLAKTFNQMSSELHKLYRSLEAKVEEKTHDLHEAKRRLEVLYQCSQALNTSQIDVHCFRHILQIVRDNEAAQFLELTVGENWRISEGEKQADLPMQILPVTMQETVYGELHWQSQHVASASPLLNSVSTMLGRGLYFNHAQKHFQQLLLMEERATIARELHDSLAQVLSYLRIQLTLLKRAIPEDNAPAQAIMDDFSRALNDAYRQLRELLTTFRLTLQQADLPSALHEMLETLQGQTTAKLTLDCRLPTLALDAQMQVHLLQIIREAVLNAMKHANASEIAVSCVTAPDGDHTVYIRDNGVGIGEPSEPAGHYGLNIMRERAERLGGTLSFSQPSGGGTLVSISFRSTEPEEDASHLT